MHRIVRWAILFILSLDAETKKKAALDHKAVLEKKRADKHAADEQADFNDRAAEQAEKADRDRWAAEKADNETIGEGGTIED